MMQTQSASENQVERIAELMASMGGHRRTLEQILEFCRDRRPVVGVNAWVDQLQGPRAVYDAAALCSLLERDGALERTRDEADKTGGPDTNGPERVVCAGEADGFAHAYLQPHARTTNYWTTTKAGCAYLDSLVATDAVAVLRDEEPDLWPVYEELLQFVSDGQGHTQQDVLDHLSSFGPYEQVSATVATSHLIDRAREAGAIAWDNGWKLTESGRSALF